MGITVPSSGTAGTGAISDAAGPLILLVAVLVIASIPQVRETLRDYLSALTGYFGAPSSPQQQAAPVAETAASSTESTERASDRDVYEFDLSILNMGNVPSSTPGTAETPDPKTS